MIAVLCKDFREYKTFLRNIEPSDHNKFVKVSCVKDVRGLRLNQIIKSYNFCLVPDRDEIEYYANQRLNNQY